MFSKNIHACLSSFSKAQTTLLFGVVMSIDMAVYSIKSGIFAASAVAGLLIYRFFVKDRKLWRHIRTLDIGFNAIAMSVLLFFCVFLAYLYLS